MQLLVLLITATVPLAMAPGLVSAFDITPKIAVLLFCESAMLLFCKTIVNDVWALLASRLGRLFGIAIGVIWLSAVISTLASTDEALSISGSSWRRDGLVVESALLLFTLIVAAWLAADQSRIRVVLRVAVIAGSVGAVYGIAQYFGWDPFLPSKAYQAGEGPFTIVRPPGTMGHADYFASWMVFVVFFALALMRLEDNKMLARIGVVLASFAILLSGTRSAMLGLIAGAVVFLAIARPRFNVKLIAATVLCLGVLFISPAGAKLRARVHWSLDDVRGGARMLLWKDSLAMAEQHLLLGFGPETFTARFPPFESVALSQAYPDFYQESPHNIFLDALTSRGAFGLLGLLGMCAIAAWAARKDAALAGGLVGAMVCQQFIVLTVPTALCFYLLIAIIAAAQTISKPQHKPWGWAMPCCAAIAILFTVFGARMILADRAMALAEQRIAAGDVAGASAAYRTMQRWAPPRRNSDLRYSIPMTHLTSTSSNFAVSVAAAQQANDSAIRATETAEDRQNAWYHLATVAALRNDRWGVENSLRQAIVSAPNWFKPHWALSQVLELTGRHAEAKREASIAIELNGGHDTEVTDTLRPILSHP